MTWDDPNHDVVGDLRRAAKAAFDRGLGPLPTIFCALCGTGLTMTQGTDSDGVRWTRQRCQCGRTDFLHIDKGKLDLEELRREHGEPSSDYEIFASPR